MPGFMPLLSQITFTADLTVTAVGKAGIITDVAANTKDILAIEGVEAVTHVYRAGNYITYEDKSGSWPVEAIKPASYLKVFTDNTSEGNFLSEGDINKIVLGAAVAGNGNEEKRGFEGSLQTVPIGSSATATVGQNPSAPVGTLLYLFVIIPFFERYPFNFPGGPVSLSAQYILMRRYGIILVAVALLAALLPSCRSVRIKILDAIWGVT